MPDKINEYEDVSVNDCPVEKETSVTEKISAILIVLLKVLLIGVALYFLFYLLIVVFAIIKYGGIDGLFEEIKNKLPSDPFMLGR
ncbi:MAG: hypothetical protein J6M07_03025 [Ruminococcus sp.]|nr:hypothetical protein [Ruminococcus sp.]MBP3267285.1 hypothetical protein [Ruminococcus sp.]